MVWIILLWMFFAFKVKVLKGFEDWFLQSFWIFFDIACGIDVLVCGNTLGKLLFIRVLGWLSNTWWSLIGDTYHSLIRGVLRLFLQDTWHHSIGQNILTFKVTHVSILLDFLHAPMCDWHFACFLYFYFNDTWQISVDFWIVIVESSSNTWRFVIVHILWTW